MSSPSGTILSQVVLRFESRQSKPLVADQLGFPSLTFVPTLRSDTERERLHGHLPFPTAQPPSRSSTTPARFDPTLPTVIEATAESLWAGTAEGCIETRLPS